MEPSSRKKQLYTYQQRAIDEIFQRLDVYKGRVNLLYQLPTGGGKTVIFSEITRRYIQDTGKKVLILTHRKELCAQTSRTLAGIGINNKVINSEVKTIAVPNPYMCFVAMVETLANRLNDRVFNLDNIGLMIIDEAHYNAFGKLLNLFDGGAVLGVTATPLSSNIKIRMRDNYRELIVGESISSLIDMGYLAKPVTYHYQVGLTSLKVGATGDYTVGSSERLYNTTLMQGKLLSAYEEQCAGKKTLIFNNGVATSTYVCATFREAGYDIRHLDHTHSAKEREEILRWFKEKPNAILTSVSILTTGFDEPTVECVILNRATKSLTLYFQMIGRGSRLLANKKEFIIVDLGNNFKRFGLWEEPIDWRSIFRSPESYISSIRSDEEIEEEYAYTLPEEVRSRFPNSSVVDFDMRAVHEEVMAKRLRPKVALERSIQQHSKMCMQNSTDIDEAFALVEVLKQDIDHRVKSYIKCLHKASDNYKVWLQEEYVRKLKLSLTRRMALLEKQQAYRNKDFTTS